MPFPYLDLMPYVLSTVSLAACVWMFVLLKVEIRRNVLRFRRDREMLEALCSKLKVSVEEIEQKMAEIPAGSEIPAPPSIRPSLNISHRAQVLRMSRRGERPEQIAAALRLPVKEVELLLKVHKTALAALA
jgi:hypothetical protein